MGGHLSPGSWESEVDHEHSVRALRVCSVKKGGGILR